LPIFEHLLYDGGSHVIDLPQHTYRVRGFFSCADLSEAVRELEPDIILLAYPQLTDFNELVDMSIFRSPHECIQRVIRELEAPSSGAELKEKLNANVHRFLIGEVYASTENNGALLFVLASDGERTALDEVRGEFPRLYVGRNWYEDLFYRKDTPYLRSPPYGDGHSTRHLLEQVERRGLLRGLGKSDMAPGKPEMRF